MNCDQIQEHLSEFFDNRLNDANRCEIENHLASCPRCLPEAKQLRDGINAVAGLPEVEPPAGFSQRVMARIREEAAEPTLWERLFQPLRIKIPLHATALLLVVGLTVYLYQANHSVQKLSQSIPSETVPALKQAPPSAEEPKSIDMPRSPAQPSEPSFSDLQQAPPAEADRTETLAQQDHAASAPAPVQEMMKFKEAGSEGAKSDTRLFEEVPLPNAAEEQRTAEAPSKREAPAPPPDSLLTLVTRGNIAGADLSSKLKEIVERSGGTLYPATEKEGQDNTKPRFRLDLPRSEYNRFKAELAQVGEIISESQPPSPPPQGGVKPSTLMRIELTFLFDQSKDKGAASQPLAN
jgi:hypothetical protein